MSRSEIPVSEGHAILCFAGPRGERLGRKIDFPYGPERPLAYFEEYMKKGCYPFSMEPEFETRLRQVINTTVEVDIPKYARMTIAATQKLKKIMYFISKSVPVKINFSDMAQGPGVGS